MRNFFRGRFSGEFSCKFSVIFQCIPQPIHRRRQAQRPAIIPRHPLPDYTHTPAHMTGHTRQPAPAAGPPSDPPGTSSTRPPQLPRRSGPGMAPAPSHGGSSQRRQQARKLYAHPHTPAGQRNASPGTHATHTPAPSRSNQAPSRTGSIPGPLPILPQHTPQHPQPKPNPQPTKSNARDSTKRARARITPIHPRGGSKRARA